MVLDCQGYRFIRFWYLVLDKCKFIHIATSLYCVKFTAELFRIGGHSEVSV